MVDSAALTVKVVIDKAAVKKYEVSGDTVQPEGYHHCSNRRMQIATTRLGLRL